MKRFDGEGIGWRWSAMAAAAFLLCAQAAPPAQTGRDVVVTGTREPPRAVARRFAGSITQAVDGQLARVRWPICPAVIGVDQATADGIAARLRAVAAAVGAPVARPGCRDANLTVVLTPDPAGFMADVRRTRPGWLTGVPAAEVERLSSEATPARAWHLTEVLNEDGRAMRGSRATSGSTAPTTNPGSSGDVGLPPAPVLQVMGSSILDPSTQQAIGASFLVVDARAATGRSAVQLADYAAMRLLAATRAPTAGGAATILRLFDAGDAAPERITAADAAYLQALYHTPTTQRASTRLESMAGQMARSGRR